MAMYQTEFNAWTPGAKADNVIETASGYHAVRTTAASTLRIVEVFVGGEATSSTVNLMVLRRWATNAATPTDVVPGKLNPLSAAAVSQSYQTASTQPTSATTAHLLNLSFNAFGGVIRWVAAPGEEIWATAATAPNGEIGLGSQTGAGVVSSHITIEEM